MLGSATVSSTLGDRIAAEELRIWQRRRVASVEEHPSQAVADVTVGFDWSWSIARVVELSWGLQVSRATSMTSFPPDILKHIQLTTVAAEEKLIKEREKERREAAGQNVAKGMTNSGPGLSRLYQVYEDWLERRIDSVASIHIEALAESNISMTDEMEREIIAKLETVSKVRHKLPLPSISGPPGVNLDDYFLEKMNRAGAQALLQAKAKVSLAKLRSRQVSNKSSNTTNVYNLSDQAKMNINSVDNSITINMEVFEDAADNLMKLSGESAIPGLVESAAEVRASLKDKPALTDRLSKWMSIASSSATLLTKGAPYIAKLSEYAHHIPQLLK